MSYVEFLVFLCRIAYYHYDKTPYREELLFLKLEHLMPDFCAFLGLQPAFLFGERFKLEAQLEQERARRRKKKLKRALLREKETGQAPDPRLVAEVRAHEDAIRKTGMGSFKASQVGPAADSDSDLGESTDEDTFRRADTGHPGVTSFGLGANEANEVVQNADLAADVGGPIGVIIPPPERAKATTALE